MEEGGLEGLERGEQGGGERGGRKGGGGREGGGSCCLR